MKIHKRIVICYHVSVMNYRLITRSIIVSRINESPGDNQLVASQNRRVDPDCDRNSNVKTPIRPSGGKCVLSSGEMSQIA